MLYCSSWKQTEVAVGSPQTGVPTRMWHKHKPKLGWKGSDCRNSHLSFSHLSYINGCTNARRCFVAGAPHANLPSFVRRRQTIWDEEHHRQRLHQQAEDENRSPIRIKLPDGTIRSLARDKGIPITPLTIAQGISQSLAKEVLVARVNGQLWDITRPLEGEECSLELLKFDSPEGKQVFWHSSAHILGLALELRYHQTASAAAPQAEEDVLLCDGPALQEEDGGGGFFYEFFLPMKEGHATTASSDDFPSIQQLIASILKDRHPFQRMKVSKEVALSMFAHNKFKLEMLGKIPAGQDITLYRCGDFIDLCRGPHVPHTGILKALSLVKASGAYWNADSKKELLQRIYGISFPTAAMLKEWETLREEALKRDHRIIGKKQGLVAFHPLSPGSPFFLPHGTRIFNRLVTFLREEYKERGYKEVITPTVFNKQLWEISGHWANYKDDMFLVSAPSHGEADGHVHSHETASKNTEGEGDEGEEQMALKPMNCPGHCLLYSVDRHSYRELPLRYADFGVLHRNEPSGSLTGLTRVRRFQQDDAHIFCTQSQIETEIQGCLEFIEKVYTILGFPFTLALSTRPAKYIGDLELWDKAEAALRDALQRSGRPWKVKEGDGAFYGPKIDVEVTDAIQRSHQCATVQLDFNLPQRFNLRYQGEDDKEYTPVMIHRAILGSVERMMGILMEHTGGRWPFWLSPRQCIVIPVAEQQMDWALVVQSQLLEAGKACGGYYVDVDTKTKSTLAKKIKEAQDKQYNYILVVGDAEKRDSLINVRTREGVIEGTKTIQQVLQIFQHATTTFSH